MDATVMSILSVTSVSETSRVPVQLKVNVPVAASYVTFRLVKSRLAIGAGTEVMPNLSERSAMRSAICTVWPATVPPANFQFPELSNAVTRLRETAAIVSVAESEPANLFCAACSLYVNCRVKLSTANSFGSDHGEVEPAVNDMLEPGTTVVFKVSKTIAGAWSGKVTKLLSSLLTRSVRFND